MASAESTTVQHVRRPLRRWLRFSLRTFLLVLTGLCIWFGVKVNKARRQKEAVAAVQKLRAMVYYKHQQVGFSQNKFDTTQGLSAPGWLRSLAGDDFFQSVAFVAFHGPVREINDDDLIHLAEFPELESLHVSLGFPRVSDAGLAHLPRPDLLVHLNVSNTSISDAFLKRLNGSQRLEALWLGRTPVTDQGLTWLGPLPKLANLEISETLITDEGLAALEPMPSLQSLWLVGTKISDAGLAHLARHRSLSSLGLEQTHITDEGLVHLYDLSNLNRIFLKDTQVTDKGISALTKALPRLHIASSP